MGRTKSEINFNYKTMILYVSIVRAVVIHHYTKNTINANIN